MSTALLVITNGRDDLLAQTMASAAENLRGSIVERYLYDDTHDREHFKYLVETYPDFDVFWHPDGPQGFGGAIRYAWSYINFDSDARYIFHLEDDFIFNRPVILNEMSFLLDDETIMQVALRRQAWNEAEKRAGGVVELNPDAFTERQDKLYGIHYLEHRQFWTTNPSLYRRSIVTQFAWPEGAESEGHFTARVLAARPDAVFAYLGRRTDPPWVTHIGTHRVGDGY